MVSSLFFPLDSIKHWNRIYGKKGFQQLQFIIPKLITKEAIPYVLQRISNAKIGSFLVVLKDFCSIRSLGVLSFPMEGTTLAIDFPNGVKTDKLIQNIHDLVKKCKRRVYPVKDAAMTANIFRMFYQHWELIEI